MKKFVQFLLASFFLSTIISTHAQDSKEGRITIEITKEINGEKKTFKGEYENEEQMRADPNYREFAGEDQRFNFWFGDDDEGNDDIFLHLDQLSDHTKSFFDFQFDDDGTSDFFFKYLNADSSGFFQNDWDSNHQERLKEFGVDLETLMERLGEGGGSQVFVFSSKKVKVVDVNGDEFGKKGEVSKSNMLELENLSFYPNPSSNGRFKVKFSVPKEDELNIKVLNLEGKEVFNRYFERFGGTYSESIDLSDQSEGIYLLEIRQGNKRLTKKIVIN